MQGWEIENYKNKLISFEMIVADLKGKYFINFVIVADIPYGIDLSWELQNGILLIPTALSEYPMWPLLISCLIHSFLEKVQKNQKPVF